MEQQITVQGLASTCMLDHRRPKLITWTRTWLLLGSGVVLQTVIYKGLYGIDRFFLKEIKNVMFLNKIDVPYCLVVFFVVCPRLRPFWSVFGELALFWCSTAQCLSSCREGPRMSLAFMIKAHSSQDCRRIRILSIFKWYRRSFVPSCFCLLAIKSAFLVKTRSVIIMLCTVKLTINQLLSVGFIREQGISSTNFTAGWWFLSCGFLVMGLF